MFLATAALLAVTETQSVTESVVGMLQLSTKETTGPDSYCSSCNVRQSSVCDSSPPSCLCQSS